MTIEEQIMKLQTYKMYEGEDTVYVERDDILKLLEQQPKMQDCDHCIHTYGTLGCCDMVNNEWVYDCEFGKEQYKKEHESQPCEDAISREDALKAIEEQKKGFYGVERYAIDECHSAVMKLPSVRPCREIVEDKRACEKCIHYVTRDSRGVVLCGCDSWECDFEEVKT